MPDSNPYAPSAVDPKSLGRSTRWLTRASILGLLLAAIAGLPGVLLWLQEVLAAKSGFGIYDVEVMGIAVDVPAVIRWSLMIAAFIAVPSIACGMVRLRMGRRRIK